MLLLEGGEGVGVVVEEDRLEEEWEEEAEEGFPEEGGHPLEEGVDGDFY